jgi:hypothetical protein
MRRRDLIAAGTAVALSAPVIAASPALASESKKPEEGAEPVDKTVNIRTIGLPVIVDDRIRNYVFISLKLHLSPEAKAEDMRAKEAFFRDALVRTGHRAPFTLPGDWSKLSENKINAAMVAIAGVVAPHSIVGCEVTTQVPRRLVTAPAPGPELAPAVEPDHDVPSTL